MKYMEFTLDKTSQRSGWFGRGTEHCGHTCTLCTTHRRMVQYCCSIRTNLHMPPTKV